MNLDRLFFAYRSLIRSWIPILPVSKTNTKTNTPQRIVNLHLTSLVSSWTQGNRESQLLGSWVVNKRQNHSDLQRTMTKVMICSAYYAVFYYSRHSTFTEFLERQIAVGIHSKTRTFSHADVDKKQQER
jgi:hypothetical protein